MKGLKTIILLSALTIGFNANAIKLEIIKKSTSIQHSEIDNAEIDSINAENGVKEEITAHQIDEDGFDTIKTHVKPNRAAASKSVYKKVSKISLIDDFETPRKNVKKVKLPKSDAITTDEAVKQIESNISSEFDDEIG